MNLLRVLSFVAISSTSLFGFSQTVNKPLVAADAKVVLAYVTSWSTIVPDPNYVTHINYAFGHVNPTFDGIRIDNEARLRTIVALKKHKPSLKVMLSVGGWESGGFSEMAANDHTRKAFAASCRKIIKKFGLDGVDLDWEYPTSSAAGISSSPNDTRNFTLLVADIRKAIGHGKLLTLASSANAKYIDFGAIEPLVDFVNIMTYDMETPPLHHAGLYRSAMSGQLTVDEAVNAHVNLQMPLNKLVLGIPFYGHGRHGIPSFIDYKDIVKLTGFTPCWDDVAKAPYLTNANGDVVCTYENATSIAIKCNYLLDRQMLGAMYWDYDGDDSVGTLRQTVFNHVMRTTNTCNK